MQVQILNMGQHTVNVMSQIAESGTQNRPVYEGQPVTLNYYTDRRAGTITKVLNEKTIQVQMNVVKCMDYYAGQYEVLPELEAGIMVFTRRKNGRWVKDKESLHKGLGLSIGVHDHYIDPSF